MISREIVEKYIKEEIGYPNDVWIYLKSLDKDIIHWKKMYPQGYSADITFREIQKYDIIKYMRNEKMKTIV